MSGFQSAMEKWKDFGLSNQQKGWDQSSLSIINNQNALLHSKKRLVEETRGK